MHPQDNCPLSMLATLQQVGDKMPDDAEADADLDAELPGVHLRTDNWQVVERRPGAGGLPLRLARSRAWR